MFINISAIINDLQLDHNSSGDHGCNVSTN